MIHLIIDGQTVEAEEGQTVLEAARAHGMAIPAVCDHPALKPVGVCKVCAVEVPGDRGPATRPACLLKVKPGMSVRTDSELARKAQTQALARLLLMAPNSPRLLHLAEVHGLKMPPPPDGCIRCRLCIRVCRDVVGVEALTMENPNGDHLVMPVEGRCIGCGTCVNLCPTGAIRMEDAHGLRTLSIRDEVIGRHVLKRCDMCGTQFATEKFLDKVAARSTDHHPDVKDHHTYCPTCAKLCSPRVQSASRLRMR